MNGASNIKFASTQREKVAYNKKKTNWINTYYKLCFMMCTVLDFIKCICSSLYGIHVNKPSDPTNGVQFTDQIPEKSAQCVCLSVVPDSTFPIFESGRKEKTCSNW